MHNQSQKVEIFSENVTINVIKDANAMFLIYERMMMEKDKMKNNLYKQNINT